MRELVTQLLNALEHHQSQTRPIHNTELAVEAAREYLATEPKPTLTEALAQQGIKLRTEFEPKQRDSELATESIGERAELIARLNECLSGPAALTTREATAIKDAADMLEADANLLTQLARRTVERDMAISMLSDMLEADSKQKETENEQQVRSEVDAMGGQQPMEVSGDCSRDSFNGDDLALVASMVALLKLDAVGCLVPHGIGGYARRLLQASITRLEADAQPKQVTCQIYGHVVGACVECNTHIEAQQVKPYGWVVKGVPTVMRGSLAKEIQEQEAKRIGGECHAFPVYTTPQQAKRVPMDEPEDLYALALKADNWGQP